MTKIPDSTIRPAAIDDIAGIQEVGSLAWWQAYTPLVPRGYIEQGLANWWSLESFVETLANPNSILRVAVVGEMIVGIAHMGVETSEIAYLWKLYVHPQFHGRSLGTRLLQATIAELPETITHISTDIIEGNEPAARFYQKHGFALGDTRKVEAFGYVVGLTRLTRATKSC